MYLFERDAHALCKPDTVPDDLETAALVKPDRTAVLSMRIEPRRFQAVAFHQLAEIEQQRIANAFALMIGMHPQVGNIVWRILPCAPADDSSVKFSNEDLARRLIRKNREFLLYPVDDSKIPIAVFKGTTCRPCGKTNNADHFVVGVCNLSYR